MSTSDKAMATAEGSREFSSQAEPGSPAFRVRFLETGEAGPGVPTWVRCLPDLRLAVWRDGGDYFVEHTSPPMRSLVERSLRADHLAPLGGVVLHSSAVLSSAGAYLFVGLSGAGKSTIARNAPGSIISDDTVLITRAHEGLLVRGTPHGKGGRVHDPAERAISGICFLGKSPRVSSRRLKASESLSRLFPALFLPPTPEEDEEPAAPRPVVETLMELVAETPCWELSVPLGYRFEPGDLE